MNKKYIINFFCCFVLFCNCKEIPDSNTLAESQFNLNSSGFPVLDKQVLTISGETDDNLKKKFFVEKQYAEKFAVNFAIRHEMYKDSIHTCIYLPVLDSKETIISHYFILAEEKQCNNYKSLLSLIKPYFYMVHRNDNNIKSQWLKNMIDLTANDFFTIEVNAYVFEHPLKIAHKGLPRWIVQADDAKGFCENPIPQARYIMENNYHEIIKYNCSEQTFYFSHYSQKQIEKRGISTIFNISDVFYKWQQIIKNKYGAQSEARLQFIYSIWTDFINKG